jgi:D-glycero-D-manno-heptose 1,7-bisphosphate phosphatase
MRVKQRRAVFFDRDGVLNRALIKNGKPHSPHSLQELIIPEDALSALQSLKNQGFLLIGATNQPDVPRGNVSKETIETINNALLSQLPLDEIRVCFHDDADDCECRKPKPGLLTQTAKDYEIDLTKSFMIGDRWRDIAAGQQAGCKTIWLQCDYKEQKPKSPDYIATSLTEAANWILKQTKKYMRNE